ncbi:protein TASOR 2 isoform X2 [Sceloporus undulatus]|nr:protein TASOR 2 isoform X2 [Sceloporus undulatus]
MSPLNHKNVAECKTEVLYHAWKGQLFIQDQQVCDIVLQSPSSISIPAQLPAKLEMQHAVGVSELRKKLPEAAFRRKNYSDQQVRYQETLFCLYKVEILNQNELKAEQLIESLKEKKLALVKYLNDQGALILLPSSSFVNEKDAALDEPSCLQALFLISSAGPQCSTAKDQKSEHRDNERSLQVTLVLPGLRHALLEAAKHPDRGPPRGAWVKRQMREFAKRCKNLHSVSDHLDSLPVSFDIFSKKSDLDTLSEKFPQNSFAHLQFYLLHPQNYSLEMSAAVASLDPSSQSPSCRSNAQDPDSSSGLNVDPLPPEASEPSTRPRRAVQLNLHSKNAAAKTSQASDRPLQRWKRKSSRLLGASTRKMWSPMKPVNILEKSKTRRLSKKKKKSPSPSSSNTPESPEDSNQLTLQLKNLQYPLRRKRGAEVLSAEFVQGTRCESPVKATSPSESLAVMGKKQRLLRPRKDEEKAKTEDQVETRRPITRQSTQRSMSENALEAQKEASEKSDLESEKTTTQDSESLEKKDKCDSHALNMLADLALGNSPMSSDSSQASSTGIPLQECCHPQDGKILPKTSDHEYHRAMKKLESASLSGKVSQHSLLSPGEGDLSPELPSSSQERTCTSSRQKGNKKPGSAKSQAVLPGEAADILDPNIHTHDISAEHSYASSALESSKKGVPHSPDLKNGVKYVKSGALLPPGKVLPFRHQLTVCHQQKQLKNNVQIMTGRLKEDFSKSHEVTLRDRTVKVTFQWEPDYLFTLDSKYTNNSLEKTVVRAVHGPWDVSLSDGIEEMKLILHMWVALFHSKPFKSPTVRTVVEHSNPAKYVSLNRIIDPLELVDNSEGAYSLEKCPADSISEATQISSRVEERAISLSDKPLSCNELSSTNCIEDELQPTNPKEPNDLLPKREVLQTIASSCEDAVPPLVEVADGKLEGEFRLDPGIPVETLHGNALGESSDDSAKHWKLRADAKTESSEAVNLSEISQSDATPVNTKLPDNSGKQHVKNTAASASAESLETSSASLAEEKRESHRIGGVELLRTSETAWLEASAQEDGGLHCEEVIKSQDLPMDEEDGNEESVEWESIDLALSDSNDTDEESRDVDLDQEGTEEIGMAEEGETGRMGGMALPAESLLFPVITSATVSEYQMDLPNTKDDSVVSPANSTSLHQKNLVEGFCLLHEDIAQDRVDSVPPQASSVQDEKVELSTTEDTAISTSQMDVGENSFISWENKGIKSAYSASTHDSELLQAEKDLATQGELEKKPLFPNPDDLTDISCDSMEEKDLSQSNSVSVQATLDAAVEFLGDQEVSTEPTKHHIFLNRMDLIEDISQDDIHLADSVAFQTSEGCQVQNSLLTQREATGNQGRSLLLVQNLAPTKEMVLIQGSCAPQKEEGTPLVSTAQFPDGPVHQTSHETTELVRNQEDSSTSARTTALPEPMDLAENTCISQEKKACHLADTVPLKANEAIQIQQSTDILEEQNTRQRFKADNWKFHLNSEDQKCCVKNENIGATSAIRDVTSDEKINQISLTISEDVKSVLCELIDAVSARSEESEETCAQETSSLNGISSSTLEYVTPPDSEEENTTTDQFARTDQRWMVNENLEQCRIFAHQDTATSQEQEVCHSALHENTRYDQMNTFEKRTPQENEPASSALDALPSSSCIDWPTTSTTSLLYKSPSVSLANPRDDNSIASVLCETEVGQTSHRASMSEGEDQLSEAFAKARDLCCTRTFHSSHRHESFTGGLGLINSLNKTWSGPTQSTLDMECLRFYYRVKEVLRKPQPPTSSAKELSLPVKGEALPLRKVPEMPLLNPPLRSRSPLLITIVNPGPRHGILHEYPRRSQYSDTFEPPPLTSSQESLARAARYKNHGQDPVVPFHLNKLNYKNKLKDSRGDISVIMDEFAEFSRVMTLDDRPSNQGREPNTTTEDAPENRVPSLPRRTASYEHLFTELWSTVHTRLKNVVQEACKKTYAFYLMETDDDPFFGRVKNLLKKAGHTETEPLLFCKANHLETERLMVIIRNEDIFPHIHKIPCLLRLKRFPNVTFAGVDSPEDILEHTYQELFQGGGFVVSDDKVLEMMTIGELKEMVKTLETLNGHGRWRWLLHYKEVKKLREDARENSAAHAKESLLKSCQGANITEALHYHQCDSKAVLRSEHVNCLLNLQVQHISQRFAVFITEKLSTNREALENKGILALDVNTFLTTAEDIAVPFRSSSSY